MTYCLVQSDFSLYCIHLSFFSVGNCLELSDGRLGLIDFGQTRRLSDSERLALARVIVALGTKADPAVITETMHAAGFVAQENEDHAMWTKYATLFFDSDMESQRLGFPTPQLYFVSLTEQNPLIEIPDAFGKSPTRMLRLHTVVLSSLLPIESLCGES